jgi:hypothetical protein
MKTAAVILLVVLLIVFGPLISIWALNTLFPVLVIPYTFETWCAVILIKGLLTIQVRK